MCLLSNLRLALEFPSQKNQQQILRKAHIPRMLPWLLLMTVLGLLPAAAQNFTIIALPDTQYYPASHPATFAAQTQWIAQNLESRNIKAVVGLGDIVDGGGDILQWQMADSAMRVLEGEVPYFSAIGNHDYDKDDPIDRTASTINFNMYFGPTRYQHPYSGYGGSFPAGSNENFYGAVTINGKQYIFMMLEFYPRQEALQWATGIARSNPSAEIILVTHGYENFDNTRIALCDAYNAEWYGMGADNDGDETWVNFASQFSNISLVLSGHVVNGSLPAAARETEPGFNGNRVNELLSNYQNLANGGNGYLRILQFEPSSNKIVVSTYSPVLKSYLTDSANSFSVTWHGTSSTVAGTIKGRVMSDACAPVSGAVISYASGTVTTNAAGTFTLTNVPSGTQTLTVQATGYPETVKRVPVKNGLTSNPLFYVSASSGSVVGHVTDLTTGTALPNAVVTSNGQTTTTDATGSYTLPTLPAVSTQVTVSSTGYNTLTQQVSVPAAGIATLDFLLVPTSPTAVGKVSGVITDLTTGVGIGNASVAYAHGSVVADGSGNYTISAVPSGTVVFTISAPGMQPITQNASVIGNSTVSMSVALTPVPSGTVAGNVIDLFTNKPIPWSSVSYAGGSTGTNASGAYTMSLVPSGSQVVTASMAGYQSASQTVSVATGATATANFSLRAATIGAITGTLTDAKTALPIVGATLAFQGGSSVTNVAGSYQFNNVPVGSGTLQASATGYAPSQLPLTVLANQTTVQNVSLAPDGIVSGTVSDGTTGMALSGALVSWSNSTVTSAADGTFTMTNVFPNSQTFTVQLTGYSSWSQTVNVVSGGSVTLNVVLTRSAGSITGKVTNASNGSALAGVTISVAGQTTTSSSTGSYNFSGIAPGSYSLQASKTGWLSRSTTVTVTAGTTTTVNVALATSGIITGTVTSGGVADYGVTVNLKGGVIATNVTLTTNSSGVYKTTWIPVGTYTVTASKTGHTTQTKTVSLTSGVTLTVSFSGF